MLEITQGLQLCHALTGVIATENIFGIISLLPPLVKTLELFFPFILGDVFHIKSTCTRSSKNTLLEGFLYLPRIHGLFSGQVSGSDIRFVESCILLCSLQVMLGNGNIQLYIFWNKIFFSFYLRIPNGASLNIFLFFFF